MTPSSVTSSPPQRPQRSTLITAAITWPSPDLHQERFSPVIWDMNSKSHAGPHPICIFIVCSHPLLSVPRFIFSHSTTAPRSQKSNLNNSWHGWLFHFPASFSVAPRTSGRSFWRGPHLTPRWQAFCVSKLLGALLFPLHLQSLEWCLGHN